MPPIRRTSCTPSRTRRCSAASDGPFSNATPSAASISAASRSRLPARRRMIRVSAHGSAEGAARARSPHLSTRIHVMALTEQQIEQQKKAAEELLFSEQQALGFGNGLFFGHFNAPLLFPYPQLS